MTCIGVVKRRREEQWLSLVRNRKVMAWRRDVGALRRSETNGDGEVWDRTETRRNGKARIGGVKISIGRARHGCDQLGQSLEKPRKVSRSNGIAGNGMAERRRGSVMRGFGIAVKGRGEAQQGEAMFWQSVAV